MAMGNPNKLNKGQITTFMQVLCRVSPKRGKKGGSLPVSGDLGGSPYNKHHIRKIFLICSDGPLIQMRIFLYKGIKSVCSIITCIYINLSIMMLFPYKYGRNLGIYRGLSGTTSLCCSYKRNS